MADRHPNIVFIMADDMGYGDVGCFGATKIPTPNMDRIAAEGVRFTDAHSSSAVCTPSRYSVLTGRYCWRSDLKRWVLGGFGAPLIERERPTVASFLRDHGYATFGVGKWHVGLGWTRKAGALDGMSEEEAREAAGAGFDVDYAARIEGGPVDLGFDRYFGIAGSLDMPPYCFIEDDRVVGAPDREKEHYYNQQRKGMQVPGWKDEEVDVTFARKAVGFIEEHVAGAPDRPFLLYLPTASPHRPCDIRPDFVNGKSQAGDRGDMVVLFDWVVGQVLDALDRLSIADDTLVIARRPTSGRAATASPSLPAGPAEWRPARPPRPPRASATSSRRSRRSSASPCPRARPRTASAFSPRSRARPRPVRSAITSSIIPGTGCSRCAKAGGSSAWGWGRAASACRSARRPRPAARPASSIGSRTIRPRRGTSGSSVPRSSSSFPQSSRKPKPTAARGRRASGAPHAARTGT
ncbi:MAG: sulfatase-like hydrolase/transferase [Planctomycetota bacterium]